MSDVVYAIDPATSAVTRRHRDGAAFVALGQLHPLAFWSRHANVARIVEDDSFGDTEVEVRVCLKEGAASENSDEAFGHHPDDDSDYEFSGPGRMGDAFWEQHPDVAYAEVFNHLGDDSFDQDCWLVKIWLKDA